MYLVGKSDAKQYINTTCIIKSYSMSSESRHLGKQGNVLYYIEQYKVSYVINNGSRLMTTIYRDERIRRGNEVSSLKEIIHC